MSLADSVARSQCVSDEMTLFPVLIGFNPSFHGLEPRFRDHVLARKRRLHNPFNKETAKIIVNLSSNQTIHLSRVLFVGLIYSDF